MTLEEIQQGTKQGKILQCASWVIRNQDWNKLDTLQTEYQEADQAELH